MKASKKTASNKVNTKPARRAPDTTSVTLRVRIDHLEELNSIAKDLGLNQSAGIQLAIGEFIQRRSKHAAASKEVA